MISNSPSSAITPPSRIAATWLLTKPRTTALPADPHAKSRRRWLFVITGSHPPCARHGTIQRVPIRWHFYNSPVWDRDCRSGQRLNQSARRDRPIGGCRRRNPVGKRRRLYFCNFSIPRTTPTQGVRRETAFTPASRFKPWCDDFESTVQRCLTIASSHDGPGVKDDLVGLVQFRCG